MNTERRVNKSVIIYVTKTMRRMLLQLFQILILAHFVVTYKPVYETEEDIEQENDAKEPLSLAEYQSYNLREQDGPGTYAFGYDIDDPTTGNTQFRDEQRYPNGTVAGSYGYVDPNGDVHIVRYVADHLGYRATVEIKRSHWKSQKSYTNRSLNKTIPPHANSKRVIANQNTKLIDRRFKKNSKKANRVKSYKGHT